jgi:hypothetical protein
MLVKCAKLLVFWYYWLYMKKRLLSGVKPTGAPHIGNYFGAMRQFAQLQDDYEAFIMIKLHPE